MLFIGFNILYRDQSKEDLTVLSSRFQLNLLAVIVAEILVLTISKHDLDVFVDFMYTLLSSVSSPVNEG